jgi:hypothetical protein
MVCTKAWRPNSVSLHAMENIVPDFVVDITGFTEKKIASIWLTVSIL